MEISSWKLGNWYKLESDPQYFLTLFPLWSAQFLDDKNRFLGEGKESSSLRNYRRTFLDFCLIWLYSRTEVDGGCQKNCRVPETCLLQATLLSGGAKI